MSLAVREWGPPDGPVLVLLHGFVGAAADWETTAAALPTFRCVAFDLPGHGESSRATTIDDFLRAFEDALASRGIDRFGLLGYSMGGRLALHAARRLTARLRFLVLESSSPGLTDAAERTARLAADRVLAGELERDGLPAFLGRWYAQPLFASLSPELRAALIARRSCGSAAERAQALRVFGPGALDAVWDDLPRLGVPVLALSGEYDVKYREIGARVADLCPRGRHRTVAQAGHAIHEEQPAGFVAELRGFFQSLEIAS